MSGSATAPPGDPGIGPGVDALSLGLFAAAGVAVEVLTRPLPGSLALLLGLGVTLLGPLGCAIERGRSRAPGPAAAVVLAGWAGLVAGGLRAPGLRDASWLAAGGWAGAVLVLGAPLLLLGRRLDRGEEGWRAALRAGPPAGTPPLARSIVAHRLAPPLRIIALLLAPLEWVGRAGALLAIRAYQLTGSRLMPSSCRFEPTCSRYGYQAFRCHGLARGALLTGLRLLRCSPLSDGGYDPVPARGPSRDVSLSPPGEALTAAGAGQEEQA